jgi:rubrerythrin
MRGMIFPDRAKLREAIGQRDRNPLLSLIRIAMEVEANSVMFYQEMSSLLAEAEAKEALAKIVKEEQGHLIKLKQRRLELDPYYAALKYGSWF